MSKVRLEVSQDIADLFARLAARECISRTEVLRRALSIMKAFEHQIAVGRVHLGFVADASKLDCELVGILSEPRP